MAVRKLGVLVDAGFIKSQLECDQRVSSDSHDSSLIHALPAIFLKILAQVDGSHPSAISRSSRLMWSWKFFDSTLHASSSSRTTLPVKLKWFTFSQESFEDFARELEKLVSAQTKDLHRVNRTFAEGSPARFSAQGSGDSRKPNFGFSTQNTAEALSTALSEALFEFDWGFSTLESNSFDPDSSFNGAAGGRENALYLLTALPYSRSHWDSFLGLASTSPFRSPARPTMPPRVLKIAGRSIQEEQEPELRDGRTAKERGETGEKEEKEDDEELVPSIEIAANTVSSVFEVLSTYRSKLLQKSLTECLFSDDLQRLFFNSKVSLFVLSSIPGSSLDGTHRFCSEVVCKRLSRHFAGGLIPLEYLLYGDLVFPHALVMNMHNNPHKSLVSSRSHKLCGIPLGDHESCCTVVLLPYLLPPLLSETESKKSRSSHRTDFGEGLLTIQISPNLHATIKLSQGLSSFSASKFHHNHHRHHGGSFHLRGLLPLSSELLLGTVFDTVFVVYGSCKRYHKEAERAFDGSNSHPSSSTSKNKKNSHAKSHPQRKLFSILSPLFEDLLEELETNSDLAVVDFPHPFSGYNACGLLMRGPTRCSGLLFVLPDALSASFHRLVGTSQVHSETQMCYCESELNDVVNPDEALEAPLPEDRDDTSLLVQREGVYGNPSQLDHNGARASGLPTSAIDEFADLFNPPPVSMTHRAKKLAGPEKLYSGLGDNLEEIKTSSLNTETLLAPPNENKPKIEAPSSSKIDQEHGPIVDEPNEASKKPPNSNNSLLNSCFEILTYQSEMGRINGSESSLCAPVFDKWKFSRPLISKPALRRENPLQEEYDGLLVQYVSDPSSFEVHQPTRASTLHRNRASLHLDPCTAGLGVRTDGSSLLLAIQDDIKGEYKNPLLANPLLYSSILSRISDLDTCELRQFEGEIQKMIDRSNSISKPLKTVEIEMFLCFLAGLLQMRLLKVSSSAESADRVFLESGSDNGGFDVTPEDYYDERKQEILSNILQSASALWDSYSFALALEISLVDFLKVVVVDPFASVFPDIIVALHANVGLSGALSESLIGSCTPSLVNFMSPSPKKQIPVQPTLKAGLFPSSSSSKRIALFNQKDHTPERSTSRAARPGRRKHSSGTKEKESAKHGGDKASKKSRSAGPTPLRTASIKDFLIPSRGFSVSNKGPPQLILPAGPDSSNKTIRNSSSVTALPLVAETPLKEQTRRRSSVQALPAFHVAESPLAKKRKKDLDEEPRLPTSKKRLNLSSEYDFPEHPSPPRSRTMNYGTPKKASPLKGPSSSTGSLVRHHGEEAEEGERPPSESNLRQEVQQASRNPRRVLDM